MDNEAHDVSDGESDSLLGGVRIKRSFKQVQHKFVVVVLALLLVLCVAIIIALGIGLGIESEKVTSQENVLPVSIHAIPLNQPLTCVTPSCIRLASQILAAMDTTVDPCTDFYNFSCGSWVKQHSIPQGEVRYDALDTLMDANQIALQKILESSDDDGVEAVGKLKALYRSCMDLTTINSLGSSPLIKLISDVGGWSLLNGTNSTFDINGLAFLSQKMRSSPALFSLSVAVDEKNSSQYSLVLQQSGISLPSPASYLDTTRVAALQEFMGQVFTLINSTLSIDQVVADIAKFETNLSSIFIPDEFMTPNSTYNVMTVEQLQATWPYFDWVANLNLTFNSINGSISPNQTIIVSTPDYFTNLSTLLNGTSRTTLENYAIWQLIYQYIPYLGQSYLSAYATYSGKVGFSVQPERYATCIQMAQNIMPMALARPYTDFVLPSGTKYVISEMADNVTAAFKSQVSNLDWLDDTTKAACIDKANAISRMVAFPDYIHNNTYLSILYSWLNTSGSFFSIYDQFAVFGVTSNLKLLNTPVDKTVWDNAPTAVNAYYDPSFNQFVFLEGIMSTPVFDVGWPSYSQYGAMGVVIGHELTHGFDNTGQQYNAEGILTPWWTPESQANFNSKTKCFENQYSQFQLFGMHLNGNTTLGENIADNGGVKISFSAYKQLKTPPLLLPALQYTPDQLFFISFGQVWCSLLTPSGVETSIQNDPHSPGPYRVIGSLQNSQEFATAFNCPSTSYMNPTDKCVLW